MELGGNFSPSLTVNDVVKLFDDGEGIAVAPISTEASVENWLFDCDSRDLAGIFRLERLGCVAAFR